MRGDTETSVIAVRGCSIEVEVDQGLAFVGVVERLDRRGAHMFTAGELHEVATELAKLQDAIDERAQLEVER